MLLLKWYNIHKLTRVLALLKPLVALEGDTDHAQADTLVVEVSVVPVGSPFLVFTKNYFI